MKKAQLSLFIGLGIVIVILAALFLLLRSSNDASTEISAIESIADARSAVESCIEDTIKEDILNFGLHGGYVNEQYSFSSFQTSYTLLSLEEMEENLQSSLERDLDSCADILDGTPYTLVLQERIHMNISFEEVIYIRGDSLGVVEDEMGRRESIPEVEEEYAIHMPEIYSILEQAIAAKQGIPILSLEDYTMNTVVHEDYTEVLLELVQENPFFIFRMTKKMESQNISLFP